MSIVTEPITVDDIPKELLPVQLPTGQYCQAYKYGIRWVTGRATRKSHEEPATQIIQVNGKKGSYQIHLCGLHFVAHRKRNAQYYDLGFYNLVKQEKSKWSWTGMIKVGAW